MKNPPSPDSGKSKLEQATAAYVREGEAPLLFTSHLPGVRMFNHPELPENRYCLVSDGISALKAKADAITQGLTGGFRVVLEEKAFSKLQIGVVSVTDAPAYRGMRSLLDPRLSAEEQVRELRLIKKTVDSLRESIALNPKLSAEQVNEIIQSHPQPDKVRNFISGLRPTEQVLHPEEGDSIVIPSSADFPKSFESNRDHVVFVKVSSGFNDDFQQANVRVLRLHDADKSVLQEGMHLRINCSDPELRRDFLIAQATHCTLKLTLAIPAVPLVPTQKSSVVCNLLQLETVSSDSASHDLKEFKQAALDFGINGGPHPG